MCSSASVLAFAAANWSGQFDDRQADRAAICSACSIGAPMAGNSINKDIPMKPDMSRQGSTCTDVARNFTAAHVASSVVTSLDAVVRRQKFWTKAVTQ